jgi:hypothetical protein
LKKKKKKKEIIEIEKRKERKNPIRKQRPKTPEDSYPFSTFGSKNRESDRQANPAGPKDI